MGNSNLCQGEEGDQCSGSAITPVENEKGVRGFTGSEDSCCGGAMGDAALAVMTCTKEIRRSEMLDIHPLAVSGEKDGSYSVSIFGGGEGKRFMSSSGFVLRRL